MNRTILAAAGAGLALLCAGNLALAQDCAGQPGAARVQIFIDGVRTDQGLMTATLYPADQGKFLKANGQLLVWRVPATAPTTQMCLWVPAPGPYALAIYDDLNSNHRFDHTTFAPLEPYGFSQNPRIYFILPSVRSATFQAQAGDTTLHIYLHYPG